MQNTMVRGEGVMVSWGNKLKIEFRGEKMKKRKEKRRKITLKMGKRH